MSREERELADAMKPERVKERADEARQRREAARGQIRELIQSGNATFALMAHQRMSREMPDWSLSEADLLALVQSLQNSKLWSDSIGPMTEYLARFGDRGQRRGLGQCHVGAI